MSGTRVVESTNRSVTVALDGDFVEDYTRHAGDLLVTMNPSTARDLLAALKSWAAQNG